MRILLVQETDWLDKGPFQQNHLMERLSLRSHEVRVIDHEISWRTHGTEGLRSKRQTFSDVSRIYRGARVSIIRPGIIKIPHLDYVSLLFSRKREIDRQIEEFEPDVIIGFHILSAYLAAQAAKRRRIPFIYYWVDVYHTQIPFKLYQVMGRMMERRTLRSADRVVVINERLKDYVIEIASNPERTYVIRGSVDLEQFNPAISSDIRKQYRIKEYDIVLFFMGWLYQFSGLKEVALQLAKMPNHNLRLFIVGEGDAYDELQRMQEKYDLQDRLILTGKRPYDEMPAFVAAADVCLLPAYPSEPIMQHIVPIKMYEYMAMRRPVIATKLPGVVEEFGDGNGVVYVNRPDEVVEEAMKLVSNGNLGELGARARGFVERYSWDTITDEFEGILKEAILT